MITLSSYFFMVSYSDSGNVLLRLGTFFFYLVRYWNRLNLILPVVELSLRESNVFDMVCRYLLAHITSALIRGLKGYKEVVFLSL